MIQGKTGPKPCERCEAPGVRRTRYRIVVKDELDERYASAFEGMRVDSTDGQTVITGTITDQSHLHGLLDRIDALGLELISVEPDLTAASDGDDMKAKNS